MRQMVLVPDNALSRPGRRPRRTGRRLGALAGAVGAALMFWAGATSATTAAPQLMHGGPKAYVALFGDNAVGVIDTGTNRVLKTIPLPPGGSIPASVARSGGSTVQVANFAFAPTTIKVAPGEIVTWVNNDAIPHTTTSADKQWDSGPIQPGASFHVTFTKTGTYEYACSIHPFMRATVEVGN